MLKPIIVMVLFLNICLAQTFVERLTQKCDNNESFACSALINEYAHGDEKEGIKPDTNKMLEYGVKACDMNLFYCYKLALIYEDGVNGVPKDMAKAMEYYKMRCNSEYEDLEICQKIGDAYAKGDGVPKDYKIASEYYKKACKHDQYGGVCIDSNIISAAAEVNADAITIEALIKSCDEKKNSVICGYVGGIYQVGSEAYDNKLIVGKPTPQNMDKCIEYYTKACNLDKNNGTSCYYAKVFLEAKQAKEANASTEQSDRNTSGGSR